MIFTKFTSSVIGAGAAVEIDRSLTSVSRGVELAAVIGRAARRVSEREALDDVYRHTIANDISAGDLQFADGQSLRAKSLDTFCPLGPVTVTADEISDPQMLAVHTRVNGGTMQDSSTAETLFGVAELLASAPVRSRSRSAT